MLKILDQLQEAVILFPQLITLDANTKDLLILQLNCSSDLVNVLQGAIELRLE